MSMEKREIGIELQKENKEKQTEWYDASDKFLTMTPSIKFFEWLDEFVYENKKNPIPVKIIIDWKDGMDPYYMPIRLKAFLESQLGKIKTSATIRATKEQSEELLEKGANAFASGVKLEIIGEKIDLKKYERAIKGFIKEFNKIKKNSAVWPKWMDYPDFMFKGNKKEDIENFYSDNPEITGLTISPKLTSENGNNRFDFHFNVGSATIDLTGTAADKVYELLENKEK